MLIEKEVKLYNVLSHLKMNNMATHDTLSIVLGKKTNPVTVDFDKTIYDLGSMDSKIELLINLNANSKRIHGSMGIYADTPTNIHLTHEERIQMPSSELRELSR